MGYITMIEKTITIMERDYPLHGIHKYMQVGLETKIKKRMFK